jgi:hypothetical protein
MKIAYSCNPDTTASYFPSFFSKYGKIGTNFLDGNLIWVAPECHDTGGLPHLYHGTFGRSVYFQKR